MAFAGGFLLVIFATLICYIVFEYFFSSFILMALFKTEFKTNTWKGFIPFYKKFILHKYLGCIPLFIIRYIVLIPLLYIIFFKYNLDFSTYTILFIKACNTICEYFLVKKYNLNKAWCILAFFFPNLTILINYSQIQKRRVTNMVNNFNVNDVKSNINKYINDFTGNKDIIDVDENNNNDNDNNNENNSDGNNNDIIIN